MNARYRLLYLPAAIQELVDIYDMIEAYGGSASARRKLAEIEKVTRGLGTTPHVGTVREEFPAGLRAIPAGQKAVICFTVDDKSRTVRIVAIGYAGSDWMSKVTLRL